MRKFRPTIDKGEYEGPTLHGALEEVEEGEGDEVRHDSRQTAEQRLEDGGRE